MEIQDKTLTCRDCGREFTFTKGEQEFYREKGFQNEPTRCPDCRSSRKKERSFGKRRSYDVTCDKCGAQTQVPFEPSQGRPVYCRDCFAKMSGDRF
ncbi:MAG: zinc-ribbon domain containing protein [Chloroflexi bacterium]|nr:zinc-ribbon domain containing protein [Chloroflexota bacterium]